MAGLVVLLLAGCRVDVDVAVHVEADGSGLVTVVVAADQAVLAAEPTLLQELQLDDLIAAGWLVSGPLPTPAGGATVTLSKPFPDAAGATSVLAEIGGPGGPLGPATVRVDHVGRTTTWRFDGSTSLTGVTAFTDAELDARVGGDPLGDRLAAAGTTLADALGLTVTVELPADLTAASVLPVQGRSATWQPSLAPGATTQLHAEAAVVAPDEQARWRPVAWGAGGVLAAVVLIELAWASSGRRRRRRRARTRSERQVITD